MNSEVDDVKTDKDDEELGEDFVDDREDDMADTVVLPKSDATDNVGDASVEIDVEALIADIEQAGDEVSARKKEIRRRLEDIVEDGSLEDTYAVEFDKP